MKFIELYYEELQELYKNLNRDIIYQPDTRSIQQDVISIQPDTRPILIGDLKESVELDNFIEGFRRHEGA